MDKGNEIAKLLEKIERNGRSKKEEVWYKCRHDVDMRKVRVSIGCTVIRIGEIDSVAQQFNAVFLLEAAWREPTLKGKKREDVDWGEEWDPLIKFMNVLTLDEYTTRHHLKYHDNDPVPEVRLGMRVAGTFKENLQLRDFPFDYQNLSIQIQSAWPTTELVFAKDMNYKDRIHTHTFTDLQSWELQPFVTSKVKEPPREAEEDRYYAMYDIQATVVRKTGYYIWNMALIMFLILLLTFTSMVVDPMELGDRLSVTLTLLLTSVAFKYVIAQSLPTISYLTFLDKYVLFCMIFQALVTVQNACAIFWPDKETARTYDKICAGVLVAILAISHTVCLFMIRDKVKLRDQRIKDMKEEYRIICERIHLGNDNKEIASPNQAEEGTLCRPHVTPMCRQVEPRMLEQDTSELEV